jgi:hypothetical protein
MEAAAIGFCPLAGMKPAEECLGPGLIREEVSMEKESRRIGGTVALILTGCLVVLAHFPALALDDDVSRVSLKGLRAAAVAVEEFPSEFQAEGLTRETVEADVVRRLKAAGIRVYTREEAGRAPGNPFLLIFVTAYKPEMDFFVCNIEVNLYQKVLLDRNRSVAAFSTTWSIAWTGLAGSDHVTGLGGKISDLADRFIGAWKAVNPAAPPPVPGLPAEPVRPPAPKPPAPR